MKKFQWRKINEAPEKEKMSRRHSVIAIIVSVLTAIIFWFFVQGVQSPDYRKSFQSVPIRIQSCPDGLSVIRGDGATCEVELAGKRSDLSKIRSSDLEAVLDLSPFTKAGDYEVDVSVLVPAGTTLKSVSTQKVSVTLDAELTKSVDVFVDIGNTMTEGDGVTLRAEYPLKTVFVNGPKTKIDAVEKAYLIAGDMGVVSAGFERNLSYELRDEKGAVVADSHISILGEQSQRVRFYLEKEKAVPVTVKTLYGYFGADEIAVSPKTILVRGDPALIDSLKEIPLVTLDETKYDAARFEMDVVLKSDDLPSGVLLAAAQSFHITVDLADNVSETLQINLDSAARVTVYKEEGIAVSFPENLVNFSVRGPAASVKEAALEDFEFVIDLRDCKTPGTQKVRLQIQPVGEKKPYYSAGVYEVTAVLTEES